MVEMRKRLKRQNHAKGKMATVLSSFSGGLSFLGGWQICHNLCLGIVAALSLIGITIVGMPLLFLTQYAVYFWSIAVLLLVPTVLMYWKHKVGMSRNLLLANIGIIIAAVPFDFLQSYNLLFWAIGGILIGISIFSHIKNKLS